MAVLIIFIWKRRHCGDILLYLLPEAGTTQRHYTATVKSLLMQEAAQQHTQDISSGTWSHSFLPAPSQHSWGDRVAFRGDSVSLVTTRWQSRHRNTPPSPRGPPGCPVQVTTLGGQCHHQTLGQGTPPLQPRVITVKTRICCELCLETRKKKPEENAWPSWGNSAAGWRVPGNTQGIQGKWLSAMEGDSLVVLPEDLDGAEW